MARVTWNINDDNTAIGEQCLLYRITSPNHCDASHMLNGMAPIFTRTMGRWHRPQQTASYASNNLLVCMAEVLYHNFRALLNGIREGFPAAKLRTSYASDRVLQIARVKRIENLVYAESLDFQRDYKLYGTAVVYPDPFYDLFQKINDDLRGADRRKSGVVYPSARHSRDFCAALFDDETNKIIDFWKLSLRLTLVHENQHSGEPPMPADPSKDKINQNMGHYIFEDADELQKLDRQGMIHPKGIPSQGYIDFVRRPYKRYPKHAIGRCVISSEASASPPRSDSSRLADQ